MEQISADDLRNKFIKLESKQKILDTVLHSLKTERQVIETALNQENTPPSDISSHFSYILPLVEEVYLLELKQKELEKEYQNRILSSEGCHFGQELLKASLGKDETVLKCWQDELKVLQNSQPALSTSSAESQEHSAVHNIVYNCTYDENNLTEDLAVTVLCQAVHVRLKIHSVSFCPNIHSYTVNETDVSVDCDTHIPGLEEAVIHHLEKGSSINGVISKMAEYISSDMAPFVISIPMKKKKKKKKEKDECNLTEETQQD